MDEDGRGISGVWNICSDISIDNVVLPVYYWDYLQVELCNRAKCCSAGMVLQTQSDGIAEVLDFYGKNSH